MLPEGAAGGRALSDDPLRMHDECVSLCVRRWKAPAKRLVRLGTQRAGFDTSRNASISHTRADAPS
jgi:hypothetical protein